MQKHWAIVFQKENCFKDSLEKYYEIYSDLNLENPSATLFMDAINHIAKSIRCERSNSN